MWLTGGKNFLRTFIGVSNARAWDGILVMRYEAVKIASP